MYQCQEYPAPTTLHNLFNARPVLHDGLELVVTIDPLHSSVENAAYIAYLRVPEDNRGLHPLDVEGPLERPEAELLSMAYADHNMPAWFPYLPVGNDPGRAYELMARWYNDVIVKDVDIIRDWLQAVGRYAPSLNDMHGIMMQMPGQEIHDVRVVLGTSERYLINPERELRPQVVVRIPEHCERTWGGDVNALDIDAAAEKIAYDYLDKLGFRDEVVAVAKKLNAGLDLNFKAHFSFSDKNIRNEIRRPLMHWLGNILEFTQEVYHINSKLIGDEIIEFEFWVNYQKEWEPTVREQIRGYLQATEWFHCYVPETQEVILNYARSTVGMRVHPMLLDKEHILNATLLSMNGQIPSPTEELTIRSAIHTTLERIPKYKEANTDQQREWLDSIRAEIPRHLCASDVLGFTHKILEQGHARVNKLL